MSSNLKDDKMDIAVGIINLKNKKNELSIVRTAEHFGVRRVFVIGKMIKEKEWEQSKRCHRNMKIKYFPNEESFVEYLRVIGYKLVLIEKSSHSKNLYHFRFPSKCVVMTGHESDGFSNYLIEQADEIVHIPNIGLVRCMNTASAFSIAIYKYFEQEVLD